MQNVEKVINNLQLGDEKCFHSIFINSIFILVSDLKTQNCQLARQRYLIFHN